MSNVQDRNGNVAPEGYWFQTPNWLVDDEALSSKAKLVLMVLLRYRNESGVAWPSHETIARKCGKGTGVTSVKEALAELEAAGHLRKWVEATSTGRRNRYALVPHQRRGSVATRLMGQSPRGQEEDLGEKENPPTPRKRGEVEEPETFAEFWAAYRKPRQRKDAVRAYVKALKVTDHETIMRGLRGYSAHLHAEGKIGGQYHAAASVWLNGERWNDEYPSVQGVVAGGQITCPEDIAIDLRQQNWSPSTFLPEYPGDPSDTETYDRWYQSPETRDQIRANATAHFQRIEFERLQRSGQVAQ